jgi:hypothetical protein
MSNNIYFGATFNPYEGPFVPGEFIQKPIFDFKIAKAEDFDKFSHELKIKIPEKLLNAYQLYDMGYFFASDKGFQIPFTEQEFINLAKENHHIFAFGQGGYGFNNGKFDIYYIDDKFGYHFNIPFGGAFMENDQGAKRITVAFTALEKFVQNNALPKGDTNITIITDNLQGVEFTKIDRKSGKGQKISGLHFY